MEAVKSILDRMTTEHHSQGSIWPVRTDKQGVQSGTIYVLSCDPGMERYNPPKPEPCKHCGKLRYTKGVRAGGEIAWLFVPEPCDCKGAIAERAAMEAEKQKTLEAQEVDLIKAKIERYIGNSGMKVRFLNRTFERFEVTKQNEGAYKAAKAYADSFAEKLPKNNDDPGRNGLFMTGPPGTGKTHLAAAIANQLMHSGISVICMTMIDMLERIKQTYEVNRWTDSESGVLTLYKTVPLLIIDDMGKEPATDWGVSKIYAIINGRYEAYMPTIATTNYTDAELVRRLTQKDGDSKTADATVDRLREMCKGIATTGESWRSR